MQARFPTGPTKSDQPLNRLAGVLVLFLPCALLLLLGVRNPSAGWPQWLGVAVLAGVGLMALATTRIGREPVGPTLIMLHVLALGWVFIALPHSDDWMAYVVQAVLLVVPVWVFGVQCLYDSGAPALRLARQLASRLAARSEWPADLMTIRLLPEVQAFRESLHIDASPALELLTNPRPAVRVAALAALEFRPVWRPGQTQVVLQLAQRAPEPEVRASAVSALANVEDRGLTEAVAELMRDTSPLVRQTATEAMLWNTEPRWGWLAHAVRATLADPVCQHDGPLKVTGQPLCADAVADLHRWAAEKGIIALRAALTLGVHYGHALAAGADQALIDKLRASLIGNDTPALVRLELARLMYQYRELNDADLHKLLQPAMPAPVRLIAVEALLSEGNSPEALAALHELARLPNREIALSTADVVQRRLGIDLGLPRGQAMPPVQSRLAAEVARRVLMWAAHHEMGPPLMGETPSSSRSSRVELG